MERTEDLFLGGVCLASLYNLLDHVDHALYLAQVDVSELFCAMDGALDPSQIRAWNRKRTVQVQSDAIDRDRILCKVVHAAFSLLDDEPWCGNDASDDLPRFLPDRLIGGKQQIVDIPRIGESQLIAFRAQ